REWAAAAEAEFRRVLVRDEVKARKLLDTADQLVADLHAGAVAHRSAVLPAGFEARLREVAAHVRAGVDGDPPSVPEGLESALRAFASHDAARRGERRVRTTRMAVRLTRWLTAGRPHSTSTFTEAALAYAQEGGLVDWALAELRRGDPAPEVASAWAALGAR